MTQKAVPSPAQLEWADAEIGVIIHFDLQVFEPTYSFRKNRGYHPDLKIFTPQHLDTDQWLAAAASAGAKYAVLVAKHFSGFCLWPTKVHDYHIGNTTWENGKGDIIADFIRSCKKFSIKPGIYYSSSTNAYFDVDIPGRVRSGDPEKQKTYNRVVEQQLTELWSEYGELFEIWFDGGVIPPEQGGPDVAPLLNRLQPDAVVFQGPNSSKSLLRWPGNERAHAPYPCWSTTDFVTQSDGTIENNYPGCPDGSVWAPAEADMPNRDQNKAFMGGWFWREGEDCHLYSVDHLEQCYFTSVGRNANMLIGMVIDNRGMVPDADCLQFSGFGQRIRKIFSSKLGSTNGNSECLALKLPSGSRPFIVSIQENIEHGENVRQYALEAKVDDIWKEIASGSCIGHKRLERFIPVKTDELRLRITESFGTVSIRDFSAWEA